MEKIDRRKLLISVVPMVLLSGCTSLRNNEEREIDDVDYKTIYSECAKTDDSIYTVTPNEDGFMISGNQITPNPCYEVSDTRVWFENNNLNVKLFFSEGEDNDICMECTGDILYEVDVNYSGSEVDGVVVKTEIDDNS